MRVLVCGSRNFNDWEILSNELLCWTGANESTIVHGGCRGADMMARDWAKNRGWPTEEHRADWKKHGKAAGPIRNSEMLHSDIDLVVAFWDGKSPGTKDMIEKAKKSYVGEDNVKVCLYERN